MGNLVCHNVTRGVVLAAAVSAAAVFQASAVVYRPGLLQARFAGASVAPADREATLIENLATQTDYTRVGELDHTYGTLMANSNGGDGGTVYANSWSGKSHNWANKIGRAHV